METLPSIAAKIDFIVEQLYMWGIPGAGTIESGIDYYHSETKLGGLYFYKQLKAAMERDHRSRISSTSQRYIDTAKYCDLKIKEILEKPNKDYIKFKRGAWVSLASVGLGCILTGVITTCQKEPQASNIVLPKNGIKIYIQSNDKINRVDTSLVRLVKRTVSTKHKTSGK